jgi:hypothetical protein
MHCFERSIGQQTGSLTAAEGSLIEQRQSESVARRSITEKVPVYVDDSTSFSEINGEQLYDAALTAIDDRHVCDGHR